MTNGTSVDARQKQDRIKRRAVALGVVVALHAIACRADAHEGTHGQAADIGRPGNAADAIRNVEITMDDAMRFQPSTINVLRGDTVRFVLKNAGAVQHEFVLGNARQLADHAAMMRRMPDMPHTDPNSITLRAGQTGELVWHFVKPGAVAFACLQPGHYDAGMKGEIVISAPGSPRAARPGRVQAP